MELAPPGETPLPERWRRHGRSTVVRCLFVRVSETEQRRLASRAAEELEARRQPGVPNARSVRVGVERAAAGIAHRHRDRREAGARREQLVVVAARRVEFADSSITFTTPARSVARNSSRLLQPADEAGSSSAAWPASRRPWMDGWNWRDLMISSRERLGALPPSAPR